MGPKAKQILDGFTSLEKAPDAVRMKAADELCVQAYSLPGGEKHKELLSKDPSLFGYRTNLARQLCISVLNSTGSNIRYAPSTKRELTKLDTNQNLQEILKNPEEYGLQDKDVDALLVATCFINDGDDEVNPDGITRENVKVKLLAQKEIDKQARLEKAEADALARIQSQGADADSQSSRYGRERKKIRNAYGQEVIAVSEAELDAAVRAERKANALKYLDRQETELKQRRRQPLSNTKNELEGLERDIHSLRTNGSRMTSEQKRESLDQIGSGVATSSAIIKAGNAISLFKDPSGFLTSKLAQKFTQKILASTAIKGLLTGLGAAGGPLGMLASWAISSLVGKALNPFLKHWKEGLVGLIAFPVALMGLLFAAIGSALAGVGAIVAVAAVGTPVVIALFLFIITAGGYMVPPSAPLENIEVPGGVGTPGSAGVTENPYIRVTKTPNPPGPFQNSALPNSVEYRIDILAKKGDLTNVTIAYSCEVIKTGSANCPTPDPAVPTAPPGGTIEGGKTFTFKYKAAYGLNFRDSIAMDTIKVTANVEGDPTLQEASGFAAVIFGTPPTRCFVLDSSWPAREKSIMYQAVAQMVQAVKYMDKLCSKGNVNLVYNPIQDTYNGKAYGGLTTYPTITFFPFAMGNIYAAFYTLAHESGHILSHVTNLMPAFIDAAPFTSDAKGYLCTHPIAYQDVNKRRAEDFAETVALYYAGQSLSSQTRDFSCMGGGNLLTNYKNHWCFARKRMFESPLRWNDNVNTCP